MKERRKRSRKRLEEEWRMRRGALAFVRRAEQEHEARYTIAGRKGDGLVMRWARAVNRFPRAVVFASFVTGGSIGLDLGARDHIVFPDDVYGQAGGGFADYQSIMEDVLAAVDFGGGKGDVTASPLDENARIQVAIKLEEHAARFKKHSEAIHLHVRGVQLLDEDALAVHYREAGASLGFIRSAIEGVILNGDNATVREQALIERVFWEIDLQVKAIAYSYVHNMPEEDKLPLYPEKPALYR